jgi:hypothetical protein
MGNSQKGYMDINEQNAQGSVIEKPVVGETTTITENNVTPTQEVDSKAKTFNEDQMRIISNQVKKDVEKKTEARLRAEYEEQLKAIQSNLSKNNVASESTTEQPKNDLSGYTEEQLYNVFKQRQQMEQDELARDNVVRELLLKVQADGKAEKIESSGLGQLPSNHPLIPMLNSLDNIGDVIDHFDENPVKVANLLAVTMLNPHKGFSELQAISQSIKRNKEALAKGKSPEPLNQLKPSAYGLGNSGISISEKRKNKLFKF